MSHTTLYRKYRPHSFADVVGQEHIVKVLEATAANGRIAHAYLFSGTRGTGKTSLARIFARAIGTTDEDMSEIDAASNRGIDDIRALRESVNVVPFRSKYKVYIVDEVHMLTKDAWNALLKTLEEPPSHVVFILATTETEKVPETIISRCQTYSFKTPTRTTLSGVVGRVSKEEGIVLEKGAADLIALLGDGSFRDTLGILQKSISSAPGTTLTVEFIESVTGAPRGKLVEQYVEALAEKKSEKGFGALRTASESGSNMAVFAERVLEKIREIILLRVDPQAEKHLKNHLSPDELLWVKQLSSAKVTLNSGVLKSILNSMEYTKYAVVPTLPLELALLDILGQDVQVKS